MSDELVFEDVNFDLEFTDSGPDLFFSTDRITWLLWFIEARTKTEKDELARIADYCIINNTLIVPLAELSVLDISPGQSTLIKRLLKAGLCIINKKDITLIRRMLNQKSVREYIHELETYYRNLANRIPSDQKEYPSAEFTKFPQGTLITVEHSKLHLVDYEADEVKGKIIEVKFADYSMPGIIFPAHSLANVRETIKHKLVYHLAEFASEKADFFSTRILHNRELFMGKGGQPPDNEASGLDKSGKNYRKMYTLNLLREYVKGELNFRNLINELETVSNNYILTRYSYHEPLDYDFLHTFHLARELFQKETEVTDVTIHSLVRNVMDEIKLYVTEDELKWMVIGTESAFPESKYKDIYEKFLEEYVYKPGKLGNPKILKYTIPSKNGGSETILLHIVNLNRLLNIPLEKAANAMPEFFREKWKTDIAARRYQREMFFRRDFRNEIMDYIREHHHVLSCLIRKPSLYRVLGTLNDVSVYVDRLRMNEPGVLEKVFALNSETLYREAYTELLDDLHGFRKLLFRIFHWFSNRKAKRKFNEEGSQAIKAGSPIEDENERPLPNSDSMSVETVRNRQDQLWDELPEGKIPRDEVDNNLSADVHVFLQDRNETPFVSLYYVADTSVNNILGKAPFLLSYKKILREYCIERIRYIILKNPHHRQKVVF
ncbi:MAG: hypothetical protein JW874_06930 [Spirochaetales bacterium]|nr:hypothetical protein [Spirochaetales bacterium]